MSTTLDYSKTSVLIVDSLPESRSLLMFILSELGFNDIDIARNGKDAIIAAEIRSYDLIMSEYYLGEGSNGQQLLEELYHRESIREGCLFVMITAEVSRKIVMTAIEHRPDDYIAKPYSPASVSARLARMFSNRLVLGDVISAINSGNKQAAIKACETALSDERAPTTMLNRKLGDLYLEDGQYDRAEQLFGRAWETIYSYAVCDVAQYGKALAIEKQNRLDEAAIIYDALVASDTHILQAYDSAVRCKLAAGNVDGAHEILQSALTYSPDSVNRQEVMAKICRQQGDIDGETKALRQAFKTAKNTFHDSNDLGAKLIRSNLKFAGQASPEKAKALMREVSAVSKSINLSALSGEDAALVGLVKVHTLQATGRVEEARKAFRELTAENEAVFSASTEKGAESSLILASFAGNLGLEEERDAYVKAAIEIHPDNPNIGLMADQVMGVPTSNAGLELAARFNNEGIKLFKKGDYLSALEQFEVALEHFPSYHTIQLNHLQAASRYLKTGRQKLQNREVILKADKVRDRIVVPDSKSDEYALYRRVTEAYKGAVGHAAR